MSEVKRYMESCGEGGGVVEHCYGDLVSIKDFDRVTAELAQANRQLAVCADQIEEQQQRLTAADERVKHWCSVASEATCRAAGLNERAAVRGKLYLELQYLDGLGFSERDDLHRRIYAELKPAESPDDTKAELAWQESDNAELRKRAGVLDGLLGRASDILEACGQGLRIRRMIDAALKPAEAAKCERCECSTVETCDDRGCGYLGAGNGAPE